jgi:1,4-dihydroxy-2-naphthoyl-CoA hydrolase
VHLGRSQQLWQVEIRRADDGKAVARGQVRLQAIEPGRIAS